MKYIVAGLVFLSIFLCIGFYVDSIAHEAISQVARLTIYALAIGGSVSSLAFTVYFVLVLIERFRILKAGRKQTEIEASVKIVTASQTEQIYIRESDKGATWRAAHLDSRVVANGRQTEPTSAELAAWAAFHSPRQVTVNQTSGLLPAAVQTDLLTALENAQCGLIVGARDSGKTTVLKHLIARRLAYSHVLVLDPHSHPMQWPSGCTVIGTERNFDAIGDALRHLEALMNKRYREIGKGLIREGEHERITIVIDEWRAIVYQLGKLAGDILKTLLAESRKTNIDVFIGSHSERVKALGVEGEGDLRDGFIMVRLSINQSTRERHATIDYGNGEIPVTLPGPFVGTSPRLIETDNFFTVEEPIVETEEPTIEPTAEEIEIIRLRQEGKSLRAISQAVWGEGKYGQYFNAKIMETLKKWDSE